MQSTNHNDDPSGTPTIDFSHKKQPDVSEFFSSTQVVVRLRQKQLSGIVRRAAMLEPIAIPNHAKSAPAPEKAPRKVGGRVRRLRNLWPFGGTKGRKAHARG